MAGRSQAVNTNPEDDGSLRIRRGSLLPVSLKGYECHFNWTQSAPMSTAEMELALWVLDEKFRDESKEISNFLKTSALQLISKKITQAFLHIETKKNSLATKNLEEAKVFVQTCLDRNIFYEEYEEGLSYLFFGLENYNEIENGAKFSDLPLHKVIRFSKIPAKGRMVIWAVRDYFLEDCFRARVQQFDFMEKILCMEPCKIRWHFYLYKALRERRNCKPRRFSHSQDRYAMKDPLSVTYVCFCLVEILNTAKDHQYPTRFGKFTIENGEQLHEMIRERTRNILAATDCELDGVFLNLAEIYMYSLDEKYRDYNVAMLCIEKALELNPHSAKAHHRMGVLQFKKRNCKLAAVHLRNAIKDDDDNIGALYGLLQILMASPIENSQEIFALFKKFLKSPSLAQVWDKRCLRTLHYLKGCFYFMLEKEEEAITSWIIAHDNCSEKWSYYFFNLSYQSYRFGWPTKRLNLTSVSDTLKHAAYIERTQFKQVLLDICLEVDDATRNDATASWNKPRSKLNYFI